LRFFSETKVDLIVFHLTCLTLVDWISLINNQRSYTNLREEMVNKCSSILSVFIVTLLQIGVTTSVSDYGIKTFLIHFKVIYFSNRSLSNCTVECGGQQREFFVEDSMTVDLISLAARGADISDNAVECHWKFTTSNGHIIVFSSPNLEKIEDFIDVRTMKF